MTWLYLIAYFGGGLFLANAIPHFASGMMGRPFQSPFAKPSGEGLSSSTVNVAWGSVNLLVAYMLICHVGQFDLRDIGDAAALGAGMVAIAFFAARHFGRFHGGNHPDRS